MNQRSAHQSGWIPPQTFRSAAACVNTREPGEDSSASPPGTQLDVNPTSRDLHGSDPISWPGSHQVWNQRSTQRDSGSGAMILKAPGQFDWHFFRPCLHHSSIIKRNRGFRHFCSIIIEQTWRLTCLGSISFGVWRRWVHKGSGRLMFKPII